MLDLAKYERPTELGHVLTPGLPILPHGVERHLVPGGGSRGIEIRQGDQISLQESGNKLFFDANVRAGFDQ